MCIKTFEQKCRERCNKLLDHAILANQSYTVLLQIIDLQKSHNDIINISPAFYGTVKQICIQSLFIEINKMFDPDQNAESIRSLLISMQNNIHLLENNSSIECNVFEELNNLNTTTKKYNNIQGLIVDSLNQISDMEMVINHVKAQRDKYYAHLEINISIEKLLENNKVSYIDLEKLLLLNINLCNALYMYFDGSTLYPTLWNGKDLKNTIDELERK